MIEPFTLWELEHIMMALNGETPQDGCKGCVSVRQKCEAMIAEMNKQ